MQRLWKAQSLSSRWRTIFIHFPYSKLEPREVQCHKCQERITSAWHNRSQPGSNGSCWKVWRRFLPTSFQEYVKDCVAGWKQTSELAAKPYLQGMSVVCSCLISGVSRVKASNQFAFPVLYLPTWCWPSTGPSLSLDQLTERWKRSFMRVEANTHSARRLNCTCQETSMVCTTSDIQISSTAQGFFQGQIIVFND